MGTRKEPKKLPDMAALVQEASDVQPPSEEEIRKRIAELREWWSAVADDDLSKAAPKIGEYGGVGEGSTDLKIIGWALAELLDMQSAPEAVKQELACWVYALGKIARLVSDYKQGRPGKDDTWHDLRVYSMMATRLQQTGNWP